MPLLDREEYIEQAHFFRVLAERIGQNLAAQDVLVSIKEEILSTTRLPLAIDFLNGELRHRGVLAPGMARLGHYFSPFQVFLVESAEDERGRFDFTIALAILEKEARFRADSPPPQAVFLFQFECLCRNRLSYPKGLQAIGGDPVFDEAWREWIDIVSRQIGLVDFADLLYARSLYCVRQRERQGLKSDGTEKTPLFGEQEGKIAWANRGKEPLLLFAALERQLQYPSVPRPKPVDETKKLLPMLIKRLDRLEARVKLLEEEERGGIDLPKFYGPAPQGPEEAE